MGCVFEIFRTLPCIFIMYMHVYPCIMYVLIQALVLQYPIFNRFVINKLSLNIISHVGARYNCKKTELGIWDNGLIAVG